MEVRGQIAEVEAFADGNERGCWRGRPVLTRSALGGKLVGGAESFAVEAGEGEAAGNSIVGGGEGARAPQRSDRRIDATPLLEDIAANVQRGNIVRGEGAIAASAAESSYTSSSEVAKFRSGTRRSGAKATAWRSSSKLRWRSFWLQCERAQRVSVSTVGASRSAARWKAAQTSRCWRHSAKARANRHRDRPRRGCPCTARCSAAIAA